MFFFAHAQNGRFHFGLKYNVAIVFFDSDFLKDAQMSAICVDIKAYIYRIT